jgi:hypothetical protein
MALRPPVHRRRQLPPTLVFRTRVIECRTIEESVCDDAKNKTIQWLRTRAGRQPTCGQNHGKA